MSSKPESKKRAPGAGRKKIDPDLHTLKKTISLQPSTHDNLLIVGEGKLSRGVQVVTDFYLQKMKSNQKEKP